MLSFVILCFTVLILVGADGSESTTDLLLDKIIQLEKAVQVSATRQARLEQQLSAYAESNERLLAELEWQKEYSRQNDKVITKLESQLQEVNSKLEEIAQNNGQQHFNKSALQGKHDMIRQLDAGEAVGFHAVCGASGEVHSVGLHQNIIFETVLLNINNGYHPQQGVFIAPAAGVYMFSVSVLDAGSRPVIHADLVKNGNTLARAYGHGSAGYPEQGSVTAVVQLVRGDEVSVRLSCCNDGSITAMRYTSFTGALLMYA